MTTAGPYMYKSKISPVPVRGLKTMTHCKSLTEQFNYFPTFSRKISIETKKQPNQNNLSFKNEVSHENL